MSEQISATHGRREDDALKREARSELEAHGEEWLESEELGADGPAETWAPEGRFSGSPAGEDWQVISLRSELARHLGRTKFPAHRGQLVQILSAGKAEQRLQDLVRALPDDASFGSLAELLRALGLPMEERPA
jgi:hypothetical protein